MSASQPSPEWLALDKALTDLDPKWYAQTPAWIAWHAFMSHDAASAASPQAAAAPSEAQADDQNEGVSAASPQGSATAEPTDAARDVLAERQRQRSVEGWTDEHDDEHDLGDFERAAAVYALYHLGVPGIARVTGLEAAYLWPWDWSWLKPKGRRRNLVRAAALLLAAIEKGDREYARAALALQ